MGELSAASWRQRGGARGRRLTTLQRFVIAAERGPLRVLWWLLYHAVARGLRVLAWGAGPRSVYLRGSLAGGRPRYGLSDIDPVFVLADPAAADRVRRRWARLRRLAPGLSRLAYVSVYDATDLRRLTGGTCLTLDGSLYDGPDGPPQDDLALASRPGLGAATAGWRTWGPAALRVESSSPAGVERWLHAWPELQGWWSYAVRACAAAPTPYTPYLAFKLIAEPFRIWLWMTRDELETDRITALGHGARLLPELEPAEKIARDLLARLHDPPNDALARAMPWFVALSHELAQRFEDDARKSDGIEVALFGEGVGDTLPLCDWTARAVPARPAETFRLVDGDLADPEQVAAAAAGQAPGRYPALRSGGLLVFASTERWPHGALRASNCSVSDPVSVALARGRDRAAFSGLRGWSASDGARRAVAEHQPWVQSDRADIARLLTAARAGLFLESLEHEPVLPLTPTAAGKLLAERVPHRRDFILEAVAAYEEARSSSDLARGLIAALRELPCYRT